MNETNIGTSWDEGRGVLVTRLGGVVTEGEVQAWAQGLERAVARLPPGTRMKLLFDLLGYEPATVQAHKAMRGLVPAVLAAHGLRPAVLDLFDDAPDVAVAEHAGVRCIAFANVHHDATKMATYEAKIATPVQRFFTRRADAEQWLDSVPAQGVE